MKKNYFKDFFKDVSLRDTAIAVLGSIILAFGLYNIHSKANITEGGVIGLTLLLEKMFKISPAFSGLILNVLAYLVGINRFGKKFLFYSAVSAGGFSFFYYIFEQFPPLWNGIGEYMLLAAVSGAFFVGIGCGLCVRVGGAPSGDDAIAMTLSSVTGLRIKWVYLLSDLIVLILSLTYIPLSQILYSLLTVILSGQIIDFIVNIKNLPYKEKNDKTDKI